jgi:hypothetical protein
MNGEGFVPTPEIVALQGMLYWSNKYYELLTKEAK